LAFGLAFQLPLIVFYLIVFNIVPYKKLRKSWRVVYVVLLVFCAVVTPDASPVTMLLMFVAMALLYEASLLLSRIVLNRRIKDQEAKAAAEGSEEADDA
jgi:sec-independent protein translocase protein TatC